MNIDDIVYIAVLVFSILFGNFYRKIEDHNNRKIIGTIVGLIIVIIVSGFHIIHLIFTFIINVLIIKNVRPESCHKFSFVFSFSYLLFFRNTIYIGIPYPPAHTNLVQMILTLKIVGLAFEINRSCNSTNQSSTTKKDDVENEFNRINPDILDMFHYCFSFIGVLTGPYYRYATFRDSFEKPFASYANNWNFTLNKLKFIPLYAVLFLWSSSTWPLSYATTDEFYQERTWLYRYWYIWPNFFTFRMRMYIGLVLSECVCTMAGLGVYPKICNPKPGQGPTEKIAHLSEISKEQLQNEEFSYDTIKNVNPYGADFCLTYREAMKQWNICVQYWLAVNIYKNCPLKKYRVLITTLVSAFWHGVYAGYYVCIGTVPFVLLIEDVWIKILFNGDEGKSKLEIKLRNFLVWFFKMHFFSYQAIAFHLLEVKKIIHYYNSVYHAGLLLGIALYLIGLNLRKRKPKVEQKEETKLHVS